MHTITHSGNAWQGELRIMPECSALVSRAAMHAGLKMCNGQVHMLGQGSEGGSQPHETVCGIFHRPADPFLLQLQNCVTDQRVQLISSDDPFEAELTQL